MVLFHLYQEVPINVFFFLTSVGKGDMLTIRHEEENEFIKTQLQPFKDLASFVWLGMHRDKKGICKSRQL